MSRLLRIIIFTLLIAAIVFFGFRASQPVEMIPPSDNSTANSTTETPADTPTEKITQPDLKELSIDAKEASADDGTDKHKQDKDKDK